MQRNKQTQYLLSSGCFIDNESRISQLCTLKVCSLELSGHNKYSLSQIMPIISQTHIKVLGVHAACPKQRAEINLADTNNCDKYIPLIQDNIDLASSLGAKYIVLHAFYCVQTEVPALDVEREHSFTSNSTRYDSFTDYLSSESYESSLANCINTLKKILPKLRVEKENPKILIENLNPRYGYGGVMLKDLVQIVSSLDNEVGICLDLGHLSLSAELLHYDFSADIKNSSSLILAAHVHKNCCGKYYVSMLSPKATNTQELDMHFPLLAGLKTTNEDNFKVSDFNRPFQEKLHGNARFRECENYINNTNIHYICEWLPLLTDTQYFTLEYDSRYVPLSHIIDEYRQLESSQHPILNGYIY